MCNNNNNNNNNKNNNNNNNIINLSFSAAFEDKDCQSEVVLALDLSETIRVKDLEFIKLFSNNVGEKLAKNKKNRIGIASFAVTSKTTVSCSQNHIDLTSFYKQVDRIARISSEKRTNIRAGLEEAAEILSSPGCSLNRPGRHIIILISDGNSNTEHPSKIYAKAKELRQMGIQIIAIGIKNNSYKPKILEGTTGYADYVYPVEGFESLKSLDFQKIIDSISCTPRNITPKTTPSTIPTTMKSTTTGKPTTTTTTTEKPSTTSSTTTEKSSTTSTTSPSTSSTPTPTTNTKKPTTTPTTIPTTTPTPKGERK